MDKKIKITIPWFGKSFCSDSVEYKFYNFRTAYTFYKKGTNIKHNEYGKAYEDKNGSYSYYINNKYHRLNNCAYYMKSEFINYKVYYVIGKFIGYAKRDLTKKIANILIPNNTSFL